MNEFSLRAFLGRHQFRASIHFLLVAVLVGIGVLVGGGVLSVAAETPPPPLAGEEYFNRYQLEGMASWYGGKFQGRLTANGEVFDTNQLTAAHRELPFGTIVRVTNTLNGRVVVVRINDRGPFVDDRVIDLSRAAADIIGLTSAGVAPVRLEVMHYQAESDLRTVQVASFSRRANAEALATRLKGEGLNAVIESVSTTGVHRVIIQAVPETELDSVQHRLASLGHRNVLVRQK
jgi:rare lipoprotein A